MDTTKQKTTHASVLRKRLTLRGRSSTYEKIPSNPKKSLKQLEDRYAKFKEETEHFKDLIATKVWPAEDFMFAQGEIPPLGQMEKIETPKEPEASRSLDVTDDDKKDRRAYQPKTSSSFYTRPFRIPPLGQMEKIETPKEPEASRSLDDTDDDKKDRWAYQPKTSSSFYTRPFRVRGHNAWTYAMRDLGSRSTLMNRYGFSPEIARQITCQPPAELAAEPAAEPAAAAAN